MSKTHLIKKEIIHHPDHYFSAQSKTLEERIKNIKISKEDEENIKNDRTKKFIRDKALGLFKIGEIVNEIINWNETIDEDIKQAKKEFLIAQYFEQSDQNQHALQELKKFLTDPQGNTLFNKILRILDDTPPDMELASHLSNALLHIVNNNFQELFEEHKYALSQIELLTPQALSILSDYKSWPIFRLGSYSTNGGKITSDWLNEFTTAYVSTKGIHDPNIINRVQHSLNELIRSRFIEAHLFAEKQARCNVTDIGKLLLPYIIV